MRKLPVKISLNNFNFHDPEKPTVLVEWSVRKVKNGFVTFSLTGVIETIRVILMKWLNGIQTASSRLFFLKIVRLGVSCEHGETAIRETRVSCLASLPFHDPRGWAKTRHVTTDAIQEV